MKFEKSPAELSRISSPLPMAPSVMMNPDEPPPVISVNLTVNGESRTYTNVPADQLLVDFLHEREELRLTGTKLNCGIGNCGACKVAVQETADAPYLPVLACFARMNSLNNMHVTTVEHLAAMGHAKDASVAGAEALHPLQKEFLKQYAFQCGFCTPGFLMAAFVLMDKLRRQPAPPEELDSLIYQAFAGQLCRCTGYARYIDATRAVIQNTPGLLLSPGDLRPEPRAFGVCFRIIKRSSNDLSDKPLIGYFEEPTGKVTFMGAPSADSCRAYLDIPIASLRTAEPIRDLNLRKYFFSASPIFRFEVEAMRLIDDRAPAGLIPGSAPIATLVTGSLRFGDVSMPVTSELMVRVFEGNRLNIFTRRPIEFDIRDLNLPLVTFALEFGLKLQTHAEVTLDVVLPYEVI